MRLSPARQGIGLGLLAAIIWGGFYTVSRHAIGSGLGAGDIAFIRYVTTAVLLLPFAAKRFGALKALGWKKGVTLAALGGPLFVIVSAFGYHFAPLSHAAVVQLGTITALCALAGHLWLGEKMGGQGVIGLLILLLGLSAVAGPGFFEGQQGAIIGDGFFVFAGLMWAVFTVLLRWWKVEALTATLAVTFYSALLFCPLYMIFGEPRALLSAPPSIVFEQALVQGVLTGIVALFAYSRAVLLLGAARAAVFTAFAPMASVLLGIVLVHETPTLGQWLGLLVASIGMGAILAPARRLR
ncbi:DMT family transporter [Rhizomicrobium palustre]|nr:DMT family transporter [Rhizomicrobium palustre]